MNPQLRILAVAIKLFATHGFEATSIRLICDQAKVNIAAVNYYYKGKNALYLDAIKHSFQVIVSKGVEEAIDESVFSLLARPDPSSITETYPWLQSFLQRLFQWAEHPGTLGNATRLLIHELSAPNSFTAPVLNPYLEFIARFTQKILHLDPGKRLPPHQLVLIIECCFAQLASSLKPVSSWETFFPSSSPKLTWKDSIANHITATLFYSAQLHLNSTFSSDALQNLSNASKLPPPKVHLSYGSDPQPPNLPPEAGTDTPGVNSGIDDVHLL